MCECGCSMRAEPVFRVKLQRAGHLILSVYPGCRDCEIEAGVWLDVMSDGDLKFRELSVVPTLDQGAAGIPIIDPKLLVPALLDKIIEYGMWTPDDEIDRETMLDELDREELVVSAVNETLSKWREQTKKGGA